MADQLVANPVNIGDIFFSGSQTVLKGQQVVWILDDTWAFKTTEKCSVSTNASPFVNLEAGQTFIIYKRTQEDIDAGNTKGIYIFDRDTVVALAYPQEVTQDLIIENEMYNYNSQINNIDVVVEAADKNPKAIISISDTNPVEGDTVTVSGSQSFFYSPATSLSYQWYKNGVSMGTASSFSYTASVRQDVIELTVADNNGLKATAKANVYGVALPPPPVFDDIVMTANGFSGDNVTSGIYQQGLLTSNSTGTGKVTLTASTAIEPRIDPITVRIKHYVNGSLKGYKDKFCEGNIGSAMVAEITYNGTINNNDVITTTIERVGGSVSWDYGVYAGMQGSLQVKITDRTS